MRRSESQRSILSSRVPRLAATRCRCRSGAAARRLFPAQRDHPGRHRHAAGLSRRPAPCRCGAAVGGLVARLRLQGTHRSDRGGADLQFRRRRRGRPHRAGRRATRASPARRCCRSSISTAARRARASSQSGGGSVQCQRCRRGGSGSPSASTYSTSLSASYEIDFWGKNRAALRAAEETRGRQPLRSRGGGAHHRRQRRQHLFPGAGGAGPACASRATTSPPRRASTT